VADRPTTDNGSTAVTAPPPEVSRRERPWHAPPPPSGPIAQVTELKDLVVAYAKQETVDPLKTLKRYLAFGLSGALSIGVGLSFGLLALLELALECGVVPGECAGGEKFGDVSLVAFVGDGFLA